MNFNLIGLLLIFFIKIIIFFILYFSYEFIINNHIFIWYFLLLFFSFKSFNELKTFKLKNKKKINFYLSKRNKFTINVSLWIFFIIYFWLSLNNFDILNVTDILNIMDIFFKN